MTYDFNNLFCHFQCVRPFFAVLVNFTFLQCCEKCVPLNAKLFSMFQYLHLPKLHIK